MKHILSFEEQVIAYLDGDLDRHATDNLLESIGADPKKKHLLETHEKLREMLKTSHSDLTPADSDQIQLALRLPILQRLISVESARTEGEAIAPTFLSWKSVISAFDISMMVLAIVGLALALASGSPLRETPFVAVRPDPTIKLERAAESNARLQDMLASALGLRISKHVAVQNHIHADLVEPLLADENNLPLNAVASEQTMMEDPTISEVDALVPMPTIVKSGLNTSFVNIEPIVVDSFIFEPHLSFFTGLNTVSRFYGSIDAVQAASTLADGQSVGIAYEIAPQIETGIEVTRLDFPRLRYEVVVDTMPTATTLYKSSGTIEPITALSPKAYVSVAIARSLGFDFHLIFEGGVAFLDNPAPVGGLGFQGRCSISDAVSFVGKVMFDASYVKSTGLSPVIYNGAVVNRTSEQLTLFTPGVLAGFGIQYTIF